MINQTISHYQIIEKLGEGGMGVVYKAEDTKLKRTVALKFLPPALTRDPQAKERFIQEAQSASALQHTNICTIHDIDETDDGHLFIVMDYYDGETLKQKIERGPIEINETIDITLQIAKGLAKAHEAGIIHRDIKPGNIIISKDGVVKIIDFGLAKLIDQSVVTSHSSTVGTVAYMSPEQIKNCELDQQTDIWALGVILFEMLTQNLPFQGLHTAAMMYSILNEKPRQIIKYRENIPDILLEICSGCLDKEKSHRIQSMNDIVHLLSGSITSELRNLKRTFYAFSKRQWAAILSTLLVVVIVIGYFIFSPAFRTVTNNKIRLGILPFESTVADTALSDWSMVVQALFVDELIGIESVGIVDPLSLNSRIEAAFGVKSPQRNTVLYGIMQSYGITHLIDGRILKTNNGITVYSNIVDPANGEVQYSRNYSLKKNDELPKAVSSLAQNIVDYLDVNVLHSNENKDLRPWLSTRIHNMGAIKAFYQAGQIIYRGESGAEFYLRRALELDSTFISPRIWLISGLVQKGEMDEARVHYHYLMQLEPYTSPFERSMIQWAKGFINADLSLQANALRRALEYSPNNNILLINLAYIQLQKKDYQSALETLFTPMNMKWNFPDLFPLIAQCYIGMKKYDEAKKVLEESQTMQPVHPYLFGMLSALAYRRRDMNEAKKYEILFVDRSREACETLGPIYNNLGEILAELECWNEAIEQFKKAIAMDNRNSLYHDNLGEVLYKHGNVEEARSEFSTALKIDPTFVHSHFIMGKIEEENSNRAKALIHYRKYLSFDSTSETALDVRQRIQYILH